MWTAWWSLYEDGHRSPVKKKRRDVHWGRLEAEREKTSVMLAEDASHVMCINFTCQGPAWDCVHWC